MPYNKQRKPNRLENYDYSQNGAYHITICTLDMKCVLSTIKNVGEGLCALPKVVLTPIGKEVEGAIDYINEHNDYTKVINYVIMPNHIHMLVVIDKPLNQQLQPTGGPGDPPLQNIIGAFKSYTTHKYGASLWQRSYYDHIIRNEEDVNLANQYIDENPKKWLMGKDEYYA